MGLQVVDTSTGELPDGCESCAPLIAELKREVNKLAAESRKWHRQYDEVKKDREREAAEDGLWPDAVQLFNEWRVLLNHMGCGWNADRFYLVQPFLKRDKISMCRRAIAGYWFDAWVTPPRRNGTRRRVDEWEKIFESRKSFEDGANKAPANWQALFVDEDTLARYAAVPPDDRRAPEPVAHQERYAAQSLFAEAS